MRGRGGYSLTEVLVAMGLLSIVGTVLMTAVVNLKTSQVTIEDKNEFIQFIASLNDYLLGKVTNCNAGLLNVTLPLPTATAPGAPVNIQLPNFWNPPAPPAPNLPLGTIGGSTSVLSGPVANPRLRLVALQLQAKPGVPITVTSQGVNYSRYVAQVIVTAEQSDGSGGYIRLAPKMVDVPVYVNPATGQIMKCQVEIQEADICQMIGSVYDADSNNCVPQTQCQVKGAYATSQCSPGYSGCYSGMPNPVTGGFGCPSNTVATQTGQFSQTFNVSCGKKCSYDVTNTVKFYLCMACPSN